MKITFFDRTIIGMLKQRPCTLSEIEQISCLKHRVIIKVLNKFIKKGIINLKKNIYYLNSEQLKVWLPTGLEQLHKTEDRKELINCVLDEELPSKIENSNFHMKIVGLDYNNYKSYLRLVEDLNSLIKRSSQNNHNSLKTERHLIFWGHAPYQSIIEHMLVSN